MLNLSRIQLELERAKERLRSVEETIQKVEGKTFSNGPARYGGPKPEFHTEKARNLSLEDIKNPRKRVIASNVDLRIQRLSVNDPSFNLKRGVKEKRESGSGFKRPGGDARPQGVFARLSGASYHQADEEDEDDFGKKPTLPSRVYTTTTEVPSRQEVIAAQAQDEQSKERNKRMFGALVGTLQKFRKEETRVREREEKRMKVEKKLEEDAKREKEKLMQEKRELFLEKKRREVEIKRIEWSLNRVKEYEAWEADVIPLKNFIQTQAKPHIFYLPSVHNAKTMERLEHSQKLVERMIEKRKTNLKEEIENSEKKARKAAAEGAEVEEAENIPEENEENCNAEQQMQVDFETKNTENGFFEEEKKPELQSPKLLDAENETVNKGENWSQIEEPEIKESTDMSEVEKTVVDSDKEDNKEESVVTINKDSNNDLSSILEKRLSDTVGEGSLSENRQQENMHETVGKVDDESNDIQTQDHGDESTEVNCNLEVDCKETEKIEVTENVNKEEEINTDLLKHDNKNLEANSEETDNRKPLVTENDVQTEENLKKQSETRDENSKRSERSREKSQSKKSSRRSRSPKKLRSPKSSLRSKRRSSDSRQRRTRRQSSSNSPPKKSRRSGSPFSRRGQRNFSSRKRSPYSKSKRRRNVSRSSSSVSPRKKISRSSSSSGSKSD